MLGGDEEFAGEDGFGGATAEGFFGGKADEIGVVVFLGDVGENEIAGAGVETFRVGEEFADGMIRKMTGTGKDTLLDDPGVGTDLEHVEIVIGFEDEAVGLAEMDLDEFGHVAEVGADGDLGAVGAKGEADGVSGVVRDGEGVDFDIADGEALAGLNGFDAAEALAEGVREDALEGIHGGFGDVERSFPEAKDLREAVAVVGVFVGDEHSVEMIEIAANGGEAGEGFALSKAGVNEDAGALGFEQG